MKNLLLAVTILCLPFIAFSQPGWQWGSIGGSQVSYHGGSLIEEYIQDMVTDQNGNVYATVRVASQITVEGDTSLPSYCLYAAVSWACDGSVRWVKSLGTAFVRGLAVDTLGGVYITGFIQIQNGNYFDTDTIIPPQGNGVLNGNFIVKYDTSGDYQWLRMPDPTIVDITAYSNKPKYSHIEAAPNGDVHVLTYLPAGAHESGAYTTTAAGYHVMKIDKDGNFLGGTQLPIMVNADNTGTPAEFVIDQAKFNLDPVVGRYYLSGGIMSGNSIYNQLFIGNDTLKSQTFPRIYSASFDLSGNLKWYRFQDSANYGDIGNTALDKDGNLYLAGLIWNNAAWNGDVVTGVWGFQSLVACMDTNGVNKWVSGGNALSNTPGTVTSVAVNNNGVVRAGGMAGDSFSWGPFNLTAAPVPGCNMQTGGIFFAELDANNGNCIRLDSARSKCGNLPQATNMATDLHGNFYVGGIIRNGSGAIDTLMYIGSQPLIAIGGTSDFYIAKYGDANCAPLPASVSNAASMKKVTLYPNPASDAINVIGNEEALDYTIYNSMGARVAAGKLSANQATIDVTSFTVGFYYLQVVDKKGERGVFKFVKK